MRVQKIALEEHVDAPDFNAAQPAPDNCARLLAEMDAHGIEICVLSLTSSAIQTNPVKQQAIELARRSNDYLAEQAAKHPARLRAFAALPLQDPEAAAQELVRCVRQLGMKGAMVKGFSQVDTPDSAVYYDLPQYRPFWATVEHLNVPFYLHPRYPVGKPHEIEGHPWLRGAPWSFGVDTATHALRLMGSGLLDEYPRLTIILGHLGETLPNVIWRVDHRISAAPEGIPAKKKFAEYLTNNFYVTTSGNFNTPALMNAIATMGIDRVLFSVDYPYENVSEAAVWFDHLDTLSPTDWTKIARGNAAKLLRLGAGHNTAVSV